MVLHSRLDRFEAGLELRASIRARAWTMSGHGFAHKVLREAASNQSSQLASPQAASAPPDALRRWVCALADIPRWPESAFAHLPEQFSWQPERRAASESRASNREDAPRQHSATVRAIPRSAGVCPRAPRAASADTNPYLP